MQNCVRKASLLALAVLLTLSGSAFAGDNAGATFSITPTEISGVGPGATVDVAIAAAGAVNVKQYDITLEVSPADAFDLAATGFQQTLVPGSTSVISPGVEFPASNQVKSGAAMLGGTGKSGAIGLGTFTLVGSSTLTTATQVTITVVRISLGPTSTARDAFDAAALNLSVTVNPPAPAPTVSSISPTSGPATGGTAVTISGTDFQAGATVTIGGVEATDVTVADAATITATTPAGTADATVDVVVANPDGQSATLAAAYTYIGIIEPDLAATTPTDVSLDFSPVGTGNKLDGSDGEATFSVMFTDKTGAAAAGQTITWNITNNGAQPVFLLGTTIVQINAKASRSVSANTGADGSASIVFDSEGDKTAGSTSLSVTASTTAPNSEGTSRSLSVAFSATWDVPVPAELASFAGQLTPDKKILLQWSVVSQSNNLGWEVYRSTDKVRFEKVGELILGAGTTDELMSYSFTDSSYPAVDALYYYLKQIDLSGHTARSNVIEVLLSPVQVLPTADELHQNFPNPFNPETTITFDLKANTVVALDIYDTTGQHIRTLVDGRALSAGSYSYQWNGLNDSGVKVGSGVYLYHLQAGDFTSVKKMALMK